jgi:hypothetical protein
MAALGVGCDRQPQPRESPVTVRTPPDCHIDAPGACRIGCDADLPRKVFDVAPDLSGLNVTALRGSEIAEILVNERGEVQDVCLHRGVREDVDARAVAAIRRWRFEPARLRHSVPPGAIVSIVMFVQVQIGG